jgi:hypothetical protein
MRAASHRPVLLLNHTLALGWYALVPVNSDDGLVASLLQDRQTNRIIDCALGKKTLGGAAGELSTNPFRNAISGFVCFGQIR